MANKMEKMRKNNVRQSTHNNQTIDWGTASWIKKKRNMPIDENKMHNLIYKIKMDLWCNHELSNKLPFYLYKRGPHSEVVSEEFKNKMPKLNTINGQTILKDQYENTPQKLLKDYPEIEDSLKILENKQHFYKQIDKDICKQYAPYRFMYTYKYEIYNPIKNKIELQNEYLINQLYRCERRLPPERHFNKYSLIYSTFTTNIDLLNDCGNFDKHWPMLETLILKFWEIFAQGLRVLHKDPYYNNKTETWNQEFENSLKPLKTSVYSLKKYIEYDKIPEIEETDLMRRINNATLGVYMEDYYEK